MVYIREAHAIDSPMPGWNGPLVEDPINDLERLAVAKTCLTKLELEPMPAVLDHVDDKVNHAYGAAPDRLYLVGKDGKIAYAGGRGPFGFRPAELEQAIREELAKIRGRRNDR